MFGRRLVCGVNVTCVALYVVCVLAIVAYGFVLRRVGGADPLARRLYHHPVCEEIDGWSVTHFFFFGLLGVLFPGSHLQFLLVGIGWEVVESGLGQNKVQVSGRRLKLIGEIDDRGEADDDAFWYGRASDVIVDILGYSLGSAWASEHWPNEGRPATGKAPAR